MMHPGRTPVFVRNSHVGHVNRGKAPRRRSAAEVLGGLGRRAARRNAELLGAGRSQSGSLAVGAKEENKLSHYKMRTRPNRKHTQTIGCMSPATTALRRGANKREDGWKRRRGAVCRDPISGRVRPRQPRGNCGADVRPRWAPGRRGAPSGGRALGACGRCRRRTPGC